MTFTGSLCGRGRKQKKKQLYFDIFVIDFDLFNELNLTIYKIIHCVYGRQIYDKKIDGAKRKEESDTE